MQEFQTYIADNEQNYLQRQSMKKCITRSIADRRLKNIDNYNIRSKFQISFRYVADFFRTFKHKIIYIHRVSFFKLMITLSVLIKQLR